jgi:uncharacterized MAPEG superfamily protein
MEFLTRLPVPAVLLCSVAISAVSVYVPFLLVGYARLQAGYDMSAPRAMFDKFPPYAQRATWAHQNAFESLTLYAPAALMAYVTGQDSTLVAIIAIAYVIARLLYSVFYVLNIPVLRSLMFAIGSTGIFTLLVISCRSVLS